MNSSRFSRSLYFSQRNWCEFIASFRIFSVTFFRSAIRSFSGRKLPISQLKKIAPTIRNITTFTAIFAMPSFCAVNTFRYTHTRIITT